MKDTTRQELQALIGMTRKHLAATEQAVSQGSVRDVLFCVVDLMEAANKIGEAAQAEVSET